MNFDFSDEQKQLKDQARRFLADKCPTQAVRAVLEGPEPFDRKLWQALAEMGYMGTAIPEQYGGLGAGYLELCIIAEELGRALAPVPFASSIYLAAEFLLAAGSDAQKKAWLPLLASGEKIGCFAHAEGAGRVSPATIQLRASGNRLNGTKMAVLDGDVADFAVVTARAAGGDQARDISLFLVDLNGPGVTRSTMQTIDPTRSQAKLSFDGAIGEPLGAAGEGWWLVSAVLDRAAVLTAFEQIGGAERALEMARDYALERIAFGRPIGSFQAIKHMLADMYVTLTLGRSNAYYGAWALSTGAALLAEAAATARVSATQAYQQCARNCIQVHGGMGFTWQFDCHLHYRRSNALALSLGSQSQWEDLLIERLQARNAAA
ncbi:MAG TPA: acyl-CoA dehydrogenase family protein [Reyranella sp.]|jgi:alkylation response protein AidB-like acyl-CoA dehydrogenase|nr:acyl-CoA dehydrogenase family protein [Reyranella sp.]